MNLAHRVKGPLGQKTGKPKRTAAGKAHMGRVAQLPCVCCHRRPVEVHHCISGRYGQHKAPDTCTIPLCFDHHRGANGIHTSKATWEATFGPDHEYLPVVADMLAGEWNDPRG